LGRLAIAAEAPAENLILSGAWSVMIRLRSAATICSQRTRALPRIRYSDIKAHVEIRRIGGSITLPWHSCARRSHLRVNPTIQRSEERLLLPFSDSPLAMVRSFRFVTNATLNSSSLSFCYRRTLL
jgi:hypothetical protein